MFTFPLFVVAIALAVLQAASLFFKNEGVRGMGRILGGFSSLAMAVALFNLVYVSHLLSGSYGPGSVILALAGIVTVGAGIRKYGRRNLSNGN